MKKRVRTEGILYSKKGQFYLIGSLIIAGLIIGLVAVSNYIQRESSERVYDLRDEIKIESANVLDYSLNQNLNEANFYDTMEDFTQNYIDHYNDKDIYFLFGSQDNLTLKGNQNINRTVILSSGGTNITVTSSEGSFLESINPSSSDISLSLDNLQYDFELNTDRNFNFVITERISGSEYIITG